MIHFKNEIEAVKMPNSVEPIATVAMKRRTFLKGSGAVLVLVTAGGIWRAYDRGVFRAGTGPAYEPWKNWRGETDHGPLALVRSAILAANAVNSQPWLFRVTASSIELYADQTRNTGAFDPYLRELHFSLGYALENLLLAAPPNGYEASLTLFPGKLSVLSENPKSALVARIVENKKPCFFRKLHLQQVNAEYYEIDATALRRL